MSRKTPHIHECAKEGNTLGVLDALSGGVEVDSRDLTTDCTPLMVALASPAAGVDLVRLLIERGADVNAVARSLEEMVTVYAVRSGNLEKIEAVLDAGADIHYVRKCGYTAIIDAMFSERCMEDSALLPLLRFLIARGAELNRASSYSESALRVASWRGQFEVVRLLLAAGADASPLKWTPLTHAIALGSIADVQSELQRGPDLTAKESFERTPWLLSLHVGDVAKAKLLLAVGANRSDRGRCEMTPLMYPVSTGKIEMLKWLLSEGFSPDDTDEFHTTALMKAAQDGATECVRILLDAGADIDRVAYSEAAIKGATNLDIVRLLVAKGADLNDISDEMRAALTGLEFEGKINASRADYLADLTRRFGSSNPEKMNCPFWVAMVRSGAIAYSARNLFDEEWDSGPVWCFRRFGKSITELPDGRIIEIAGEHEDHYDPDFCIYNDVIVHKGGGVFDIYGYPSEIFPPTDFHTATLVGKYIYIIGNLSYPEMRVHGETQVIRLHIDSFAIEKLAARGTSPGWISRHKAVPTTDNQIRISGGKICAWDGAAETYIDNSREYVLDLETMTWTRVPSTPG